MTRSFIIKIVLALLGLGLGVGVTYLWLAYGDRTGDATIPPSVLKDLEPTVATPLAATMPPNVLKDLEPTKQ